MGWGDFFSSLPLLNFSHKGPRNRPPPPPASLPQFHSTELEEAMPRQSKKKATATAPAAGSRNTRSKAKNPSDTPKENEGVSTQFRVLAAGLLPRLSM
jgi:hypothetical protein